MSPGPRSSRNGGEGERTRAASLFDAARWMRLSALRLPSFKGGVFWRRFWLGFSWREAKLGCVAASRERICACRKRTSFKGHQGIFKGQGYGAATTHAKLSGAAHARRVAGAAIARAQRFDPARAVRFAGIVPLLRQEALPPAAHMLRRRPGGVRLQALAPQEGQAQDAVGRMEPARAPQVVVAPRCGQAGAAAAIAPGRPIRHLGVV